MSSIVIHACPLFRRGLQYSLQKTKFRCVAAVSRLEEVPDKAIHTPGTLCILGCENQGWSTTMDTIRRIRAANSTIPIVIVHDRFESMEVSQALEAGATAFLTTDVSCEALVNYLSLISLGEVVVPVHTIKSFIETKSGSLTQPDATLVQDRAGRAPLALGASQLSVRENHILQHLLLGASNKSIARQLQVSLATVKVHVKAIFRKIRVQNRTQAAMWASCHLTVERPVVDQTVQYDSTTPPHENVPPE